MAESPTGYQQRLAHEHETFAANHDVHGSLPPAAHHWSRRHLTPKLAGLGVAGIEELVIGEIGARARRTDREVVVLSLGSGNGDREIAWLRALAEAGVDNVRMRLLEINPDMQDRALASAHAAGLAGALEPVIADFNTWSADVRHDVVVGYQALHHVLDLEHLYAQISAGARCGR
jgi:hypothetical protein